MAIVSDSELLLLNDAARLLGVSAKVVRSLIRAGELQARRAGRRQYVSRPSVLAYLNKDTDVDDPDSSFEADDDESVDVSEMSKPRIDYKSRDGDIGWLYHRYCEAKLDIAPEFQRFYVFDRRTASRLIESIFLDVPVPAMYFAEQGNKWIVIDGHQRLHTYFDFRDGNLKLADMEFLPHLEGKTWNDLSEDDQQEFLDRVVQFFLIERDNDPNLTFSVSHRLNRGAVKLNEMELRNCLYQGPFTRMLAELSRDDSWLDLMGYTEPHKRMKDRELILRLFAVFTAQNEYHTPLKTFLSEQMEALNKRNTEYLDSLRDSFLNAVKLAKQVFPNYIFRRFAAGDADNPNGVWSKMVNLALFEVVMVSLAKQSRRDVFLEKEDIQERMLQLMTDSEEFVDTITISASQPFKFRRRHEIWSNALSEVLGSSADDPRFFRKSMRRKLYKQDKTCHICHQEITEFDDATVDHVQPYSKGGRTTPDNARLAHRFCNSSKGAR